MMMDQRQREKLLHKTEACGLVAGVAADLRHVTVPGNTNNVSHSQGSGRIHHFGLVPPIGTVHRKKRMPRQRRSTASSSSSNPSLLMHHSNHNNHKPRLLPPPPSSSSHMPLSSTTLRPAREIDHRRLRFLFQKELKNSDVSSLRRMILPKEPNYNLQKAAEAFLPPLDSKEGIVISMDDIDGLHVIQAKKASDQDEFMEENSDTINDIFLNDYEVSRPGCFDVTYPIVNDTGMSFIYETTFSNDSPLDFLGGSMTNFSRIGPVETFGSVENLSLDDFY
ncbi:hypothetical protein Fmac_029337 [Flemingia macrophylla]|uniref:Uncharacterized protein n=1 Tax=Flemingia macrophylla TaxID=520843 RepID=A0ABD1LA15_9FABA